MPNAEPVRIRAGNGTNRDVSNAGVPNPLTCGHHVPNTAHASWNSNWWLMALPPTFSDSTKNGLTSGEARERFDQYGPNEPRAVHRRLFVFELLGLFANPLAIILLAAAGVSVWMGDSIGAGIIVAIVLTGAVINFIQTYRSARAISRLREGVAVTATVLRDGNWIEVPRRKVVPGDQIRLSAGDLVPADARLVAARDLHIQQAALTGESLPVEKEVTQPPGGAALKTNDADAVFFGTSVVSGTAAAMVVATGPATAFGEIAARLAERQPETEFDRGTRRFGLFITQTVFVLVFSVFLSNAVLKRDPLESILFAIALAVGLTPEFLPMITAVTLATGAVRMARKKVVVKHLAAMQNLGSMDVLCSDKTGTLTRGEMELIQVVDAQSKVTQRPFELAYLNSSFETGIKSPLDTAILRHRSMELAPFRKVDEIPFDFERRRLSVVVDGPEGRVLIAKGAPESILSCCTHCEIEGATQTLDGTLRASIAALCATLSGQGFRLLAVSMKPVSEQESFRVTDEVDLTLIGLLAFLDPPREEASEVLAELRDDGVAVKILTGDNELVTRYVCGKVGLDSGNMVLGDDVDGMTDGALGARAERTSVFARLSPAQKNRVLRALKSRGHVVGFLGDGINAAPSLHAADVGITVSTAVDVAKDAAEVVLLEPGLRVLHSGIREGRQAFGNVMKYLLMGTSSNFGNMLSMAAATALLPFLPMLPMQILFTSLLYDIAQLTIPTDHVDPSYVRKPRRWDITLIRRFMLWLGPVSSAFDFLTFAVLLHVFHADAALFHTGWFVESLATQTLVLFVIRTGGNPLRSQPSRPLVVTVLAVVMAGVLLPYTSVAASFGFVPLPSEYLVFVVAATASYLALVEVVKRSLLKRAFL
jgi:P-type Mg2+ transporter